MMGPDGSWMVMQEQEYLQKTNQNVFKAKILLRKKGNKSS